MIPGVDHEYAVFFEKLFDNSPEGVVIQGIDGTVLKVNRMFCEMFGYSHEEVIGQDLDLLVGSDKNIRKEASSFTKKSLNGEEITFESIRQKKDGSRFHVLAFGFPITSEGKVVAIYGMYRDISDRKQAEEALRQSSEKLEKALDDTVKLLAGTMRIRDVYTADHQENTARLVDAIAREMGLSEERCRGLWVAAMIHDIGKLQIPGEILNKPTSLSSLEYEIVKRHAEVGAETLRGVSFPWDVANIIAQHHERLDGSGYPRGLKGKDIIEDARILSVADVVEAMCSHRPFRPAHSVDAALEAIRSGSGTLFDKKVVQACCTVFEKGFTFQK